MVTPAPAPADDSHVWVTWVLAGLVAWFVVAFSVAVVIGRGVTLAEGRTAGAAAPLTASDLAATSRAVRVPLAGVRSPFPFSASP